MFLTIPKILFFKIGDQCVYTEKRHQIDCFSDTVVPEMGASPKGCIEICLACTVAAESGQSHNIPLDLEV